MKRLWVACLAATVVALSTLSPTAAAEDEKVELKQGDKAPAFECTDDAGKAWKSADHYGKKIVVLYFYPAAMTGC